MTLNARFSQLRRNEGRIGGGGGGVRRGGGIVKRNANRGATSRNHLLALQMANRPAVRAALNRGGGRGGRGGRGGFVPRGGYRQGGYQQQGFQQQRGGYRQQNQRRGGAFNTTRAAVIAAIHSSQANIPSFRVNNRGNNRQSYGNLNRVQSYVNVSRPNFRLQQQQQIQRVNNRGAIQRVGRGRGGGLRGRGNIARRVNLNVQKKLPVQQRLGVRQNFNRGTARIQKTRGVQQKTRGGQRGGRVQVQQGRQQQQKNFNAKTVKKVGVKRVAGGKIVKTTGAKTGVAAKRGMIRRGAGVKRGATAIRRGSRVLARGGAARAGSRVIQRGRPAIRGRAGVRGRGTRGRPAARTPAQQPSKESLDLDLENYMANTKTFLDKDIDSYMMSQPQGTVSSINPIIAPV